MSHYLFIPLKIATLKDVIAAVLRQ